MTEKQTKTLVLFSQNYSLPVIAKKQMVSLTTIRQRIKALSKNHSREFNNALGVRESYKRTRDSLRKTQNFSNLPVFTNWCFGSFTERISEEIKEVF